MKNVITAILSVVLLATVLTMFASCGNNSPEDAVKAYADMLKSPSAGNIKAVAPESFWNELESEYDVTVDMIAAQFNGGRKIEYEIISTEEVDDLDEWKEQNGGIPGVDTDDITAVYTCELDTNESRVFYDTFTVIEVDGKYYAVEAMKLLAMSAVSL